MANLSSATLGFLLLLSVACGQTVQGMLEGSWEFAQPVHMCFVDLEKAFDRVPRGILWEVLWEYGVHGPLLRAVWSLYDQSRSLVCIASCKSELFPVHVGLWQGCPLSPVLFIVFMDRISRRSQGLEGVLLAPSSQDLQRALGCFAAECEVAGMRISTSKSEAMVLDRKNVACTLQVGGEFLPQVEEFKYLGVLFTSKGRMDCEIDRRIGAAAAVMRSRYQSVVVKKELIRKPYIGGSVVGCSPIMRKARVRFPANASTPATGCSAGPKPGIMGGLRPSEHMCMKAVCPLAINNRAALANQLRRELCPGFVPMFVPLFLAFLNPQYLSFSQNSVKRVKQSDRETFGERLMARNRWRGRHSESSLSTYPYLLHPQPLHPLASYPH
ncbi:hypothetical protein QTP70_011255 [Hemibagrus guttatus]|uniref:Reverse transcriptase domain-containing protein n=1 Tax=Hemibagrus guttatus TaxID=175788 RepID=A0AAE0Q101_9TELE|nr:hypothetical protein QTP70_011255 [Hemibagrus guttatus]